jgi:uncharacterized protein (TIGR01244 family)
MPTTAAHVRWFLVLLFVLGLCVAPGTAQSAAPQAAQSSSLTTVQGVRNFTRVDSTIACGGALTLEAFGALRQAGYKSVVNLRPAFEPGAIVDRHRATAEAAGLRYIHLPFDYAAMDAAMVDEFLKAVVKPANLPMLLQCASGNRASMFWAVKRVMVDGWPVEKAMGELTILSQNASPQLRAFVLGYLRAHGKHRP